MKKKLGEMDAPRAARVKSLRVVDFLAFVDEGVRSRLAKPRRGVPAYDGWETRQRFGYVQYWRDESFRQGGRRAAQSGWMHYEVWVQRKTQRLEIGLHFEGERERSYAAAALLADNMPAVVEAIGPEWELEEWTASWTRLHRSFAAPALTAELADEAAERAVGLMVGMEPLVVRWGIRDGG